jgi:hypothetical protein
MSISTGFFAKAVIKINSLLLLVLFTCQVSARQKTSLIPLPQLLEWTKDSFPLNLCNTIIANGSILQKEAVKFLVASGRKMDIKDKVEKSAEYFIQLQLGEVPASFQQDEAYHLIVNNTSVTLTANTPHGIFNGLQTLYQLINNNRIAGCNITDYPAFSWRGYMVDVGRNFQSVEQLKQQIDIMAKYKMNIFHFHLTEDVAWRLQIKQYPQLTLAKNMQRNKGKFYSIMEMKDIIKYCKERYITLIPEIDMPGHSGAFRRAMGTDMQSPEGAEIVKKILAEVCSTYNIIYLHIGADEVKITNEHFLPEITKLIEQYNKVVVAWAPGGNYDDQTIRQLWKEEGNKDVKKNTIKYVDSRFLYISDFDPLTSVVTIFNRQMGGRLHSDTSLLGAEFCVWNDRKVSNETDVISKNPVYPDMLAFAERTWRGGGYSDVQFYIGADGSKRALDFVEFEKRLLVHKEKYFSKLPFTYVKQTHIKWNLFGPFYNKGNLSTAFWPEKQNVSIADSTSTIVATGGTIWLWPTHFPIEKAWLKLPEENTTWYASTNFWIKTDTILNVWIGFKDLSRSGADATPPKGKWDYMESKLWVNGVLIPPPNWTFPGRPSGRLEEPMIDENFYYRKPTNVKVKKGWNTVLVKLPLNTFNPNLDWQVPPKIMFTFIPVHKSKGMNWEGDEIKFRVDKK